jgi:hypothetical protein
LSIAGDALDHQQDCKAGVGEEEDVEGLMSSLHANAPDQEAILAISIIPATESKCEAVVSCGAPPEAPQQALKKWEEGGQDDNRGRAASCNQRPSSREWHCLECRGFEDKSTSQTRSQVKEIPE